VFAILFRLARHPKVGQRIIGDFNRADRFDLSCWTFQIAVPQADARPLQENSNAIMSRWIGTIAPIESES
jgi:hypothetical protein